MMQTQNGKNTEVYGRHSETTKTNTINTYENDYTLKHTMSTPPVKGGNPITLMKNGYILKENDEE